MGPHQPIFREVVTRRLMFPEELTEAVVITRPADWLIMGTLAVILITAILWSAIDTLPMTVQAEGVVRGAGATTVLAPLPGIVRRICIGSGVVDAGTILMEIIPNTLPAGKRMQILGSNACNMSPDNHTAMIRVAAPFRARLLEVRAAPGDRVTANMPLLVLAPADQPLQAVLFVRQNLADRIHPGLTVQLTSEMLPASEGRHFIGTVSRVWPGLISDSGLRQLLDQEPLVRDCIVRGLRVRVDVSLDGDEHNRGGLLLSSVKDSESELPVGASIAGDILVAREHPIVWLLRRARFSGSQ